MDEGDAKLWKDQFLENTNSTGTLNLGTWNAFQDKFKKAFKTFNALGDMLKKLISLRKGDNTIEDHIA